MALLTEIEKTAKFSFIEITFLTKVEKSILNAAGTTGGNITELKKTTEIDGTQRVFVSGSSMKWSIKKYWKENKEEVSPIEEKVARGTKNNTDITKEKQSSIGEKGVSSDNQNRGAQISSSCNPEKYIDDDLFGYFNTAKGLARYAPIKTSGMISLFDVGPDIDNLVRYSQKSENHSMFDKEISTNIFRSSWAIEIDRVGKANLKSEIKDKPVNLPIDKREKRIKLFLEAIFNIWQRTQQTNYLTNTQPDLMTVIFREDKSLVVGNKLTMDDNYTVNLKALKEILLYHKDKISLAYVASHKSFAKNYDELEALNGNGSETNLLSGNLFASDMITLKEKLLSKDFKMIR